MKEDLEKEKAELQRQITVNEELIKTTQTAVYWLKKRVRLVDAQLKGVAGPSDAETAQDISEGLDK